MKKQLVFSSSLLLILACQQSNEIVHFFKLLDFAMIDSYLLNSNTC